MVTVGLSGVTFGLRTAFAGVRGGSRKAVTCGNAHQRTTPNTPGRFRKVEAATYLICQMPIYGATHELRYLPAGGAQWPWFPGGDWLRGAQNDFVCTREWVTLNPRL